VVEKYDSVTHEALPGCTFQLRFLGGTSGTGGTVIGQKVTGQNGTCIWTGLTAGTYIVEEIDPADGYSIINSSETVYISDDGKQDVITVSFDNSPDGILLIRKVCSVNPSITLQNAEFKIMYADGALIGDSNGIYRTDEKGEIRIPGLKPGKSVIVTETKAPAGFLIDTQSQTIQIKEGRTVSLTFKNQPIIQRLYEDNVSGKLTDERFAKMSATYEREQKELESSTYELQKAVDTCEQQQLNIKSFLQLVRNYIEPEQLTPEILRMFIEKIVVHSPDRSSGQRIQQIDIHYNFVGQLDISVETAKTKRRTKAEMDAWRSSNQQSI